MIVGNRHRYVRRALLAGLALLGGASFATAPASSSVPGSHSPVLLVFAASSLTNVLEELGPLYQRDSGIEVKFSFAASSVLARQIEAGAGAGVFASADQEWMDYLQQRRLIEVASRRNVAANALVLVAPQDSTLQLRAARGMALGAALGRGRLATGDPDSVPAGRYARMALTSLGVWNEVADRIIRADNVRTALRFVASGDAPLGIVYATDAAAEPGVRVLDTFPVNSHLPITYPVAVTLAGGDTARGFVAFLGTAAAQAVFRKYGFTAVPP